MSAAESGMVLLWLLDGSEMADFCEVDNMQCIVASLLVECFPTQLQILICQLYCHACCCCLHNYMNYELPGTFKFFATVQVPLR
jgi:hypothetical protein